MASRLKQDRFHLLRTFVFSQPLELQHATYHAHVFPRHWNETFVVQLVEQGVNEFYCRGRVYQAAAGELVLLHPQEVHTGHSIGAEPLSYRTFYPSDDLFKKIHEHIGGASCATPYFLQPVERDAALAQSLRRAFRIFAGQATQLARQTALVEMLGALVQRHANSPCARVKSNGETDALRRAQTYLAEHVAHNISLAELAQAARLSAFHLAHVFRKTHGLAPHEYLLNLRIARAKELLRAGREIVETARLTGFFDQSHFSKRFKRLVGLTPGQYAQWCRF